MELPDDLDALEAELDPAARYVVKLLRQALDELKQMVAERDSHVARLSEQLSELQRMLFGKRSEKLPPIESEVRRVLERDELTVEGIPCRPIQRISHASVGASPARSPSRSARRGEPYARTCR